MNYSEFRKTYKWMLSKYPGTDRIYCDNMQAEIGKVTIINYAKSGNTWKETERKTENFSPLYYANTVDAIPFFKNFGGSERAECGYTKVAYLPVKISSISPDKALKTVRIFKFD